VPRWLSRLFRPEVGFFVLCWLGLTVHFRTRAFQDPGALWHVKVGELILDHGFMTTDPFTYTFAGKTWIPQQWGGEVLMALAHRAGGFDTMLLAFAAGLAGLFTWVFSRMVRNGLHPALAGVLTAGAVVISGFHFYARPHLFTIAGMAVTMAAIVDYERGRSSAWRLWWLIPFNVLWTNIHGGVLGGVVTLGIAVIGWGVVWLARSLSHGLNTMWNGESASRPADTVSPMDLRKSFLIVGIVAACGLTPFVNPFGMEMLRTWQKIVGSEAMKEMVSEHQPLSLNHTAGQVVAGFAAFYLFALLGTLPKRPRVSWLLPLVWFALSVNGIRQGPLFAVIGAIAMADLWPHTVWHRLLKKYGDSLAREPEEGSRGWAWATIPAMLVLGVLGLQIGGVQAPVVGRGWAGLDPGATPLALAEPLREYARTAGTKARLFNDANLGGFVIYHEPKLKVFMDDRFELYGDSWLRQYVQVVYDHPERFEAWADEYRFDAALVAVLPDEHRLPLEKYLSESPRWVVISRCDRGALFRRVADPQPFRVGGLPPW
jgi:hypothetical protein